jgi:hypothetical protein
MPGQGRGKLFLLAPLAISILHCALVFYPFEVDCVIAQDRQKWGRSAGPGPTCSGQGVENHVRSDGVDVYCEGGLIGCRCLVKNVEGEVVRKVERDTNEKVNKINHVQNYSKYV